MLVMCFVVDAVTRQWAQSVDAVPMHRSLLNIASRVHNDRRLDGCCAPSNTESMSVLYVNERGQFVREDLHGVVVEGCECV